MTVLAGTTGLGGAVACCGLLFVLLLVALVFWYWKNQPDQKSSAVAPAPPIQATIEHPTAATTNEVAPPAPVAPPTFAPDATRDSQSAPPSADA
ncbi:MAG TPA: hypothetical protein VIL41_01435 [Coriobacteriia bacterium]